MIIEKQVGKSVIKIAKFCSGSEVKSLVLLAHEVLNGTAPNLILDFTQTEMLDSEAIGSLVALAKDFKNKKAGFVLRKLPPVLSELFFDTDLDKLFNIETETGVQPATVDLFEKSADIRLDLTSEEKDDVYIFHLSGLMSHPVGSRYLKQQFLLALATHKKILIDFEELTFFDSLSVSTVLMMNTLLKKTGGSLRICGVNNIVQDLFSTLNIDQIIPFFGNMREALDNWNFVT